MTGYECSLPQHGEASEREPIDTFRPEELDAVVIAGNVEGFSLSGQDNWQTIDLYFRIIDIHPPIIVCGWHFNCFMG